MLSRFLPAWWKLAAAGVVVLALLAAGMWFRGVLAERDRLRVEVSALEHAVAAREATIAQQRDAIAMADADRRRAEAAYRTLQTARERVLRAPESDDAALAPVLDDALRSLRERATAGATP